MTLSVFGFFPIFANLTEEIGEEVIVIPIQNYIKEHLMIYLQDEFKYYFPSTNSIEMRLAIDPQTFSVDDLPDDIQLEVYIDFINNT